MSKGKGANGAGVRRFLSDKRYLGTRRLIAAALVLVLAGMIQSLVLTIRGRGAAPVVKASETTWVGYADSYLGIRLRYPNNWRLLRDVGRSIKLYPPDGRYILSICATDKSAIDDSCRRGNYRGEPTQQDGSVAAFNLSVPREKVKDARRGEYYYPKDVVTVGNGQIFFAATWYTNLEKVTGQDNGLDGYRPIAEQILATLQQI